MGVRQELIIEVEEGVPPGAVLHVALRALARELGVDEELVKAVAPHPSHYQQRTARGRFARPHAAHVTPREKGRFRQRLSREECGDAVGQARSQLSVLESRLRDHIGDYTAERIPREEWQRRCIRDIQDAYERLYRLGKQAVGDPGVALAPQDRAIVNRLAKDELTYLEQFGKDVDAGVGILPYEERMALYALAGREAFWLGWVMGDQRRARDLRWVLGPTEHCKDCQRFAEMGWLPVARFVKEIVSQGFSPQSGALECQGHRCKCAIRERLDGVAQPAVEVSD